MVGTSSAAKRKPKPDLTGTWKLNPAKSDFGFGPQPRSRIDTIEHKEPHLRISTHLLDENGESTTIRDMTTDGKVVSQAARHYKARWDDTMLVIEVRNNETNVKTTARLQLSRDRNTLTRQQRWFFKTHEEAKVTLLMERQGPARTAIRAWTHTRSDESAIRKVIANFEEAYARRDGALWVKYFTEDADFTQAFGVYRQGRSSIAQFMGGFMARQPAIHPREIGLQISFVRPEVAFVDYRGEVAGIRNRNGSEQPLRRGHMLLVMKKMQGDWKIVHYRFFDVHMGAIRKEESAQRK